MVSDTRQRIIDASLRLFGERGFAATSVAQIEHEAGLSSGAGGLYRHFRSKEALLIDAVRSRLADRSGWAELLSPEFAVAQLVGARQDGHSTVDQLTALCRLGLQRLDHDRDVSRLLMRESSLVPEALEVFRTEEYEFAVSLVTKGLHELAPGSAAGVDWRPSAAVVVGAIVHYWLITDIFDGTHPLGIDPDTYCRATATMIAALMSTPDEHPSRTEPPA